jgi:hypothetical protein
LPRKSRSLEVVRVRKVGRRDRDFTVGLGELRRGCRYSRRRGLAGDEEEEGEEERGFEVHFAGDAEPAWGETWRKIIKLSL